MKRILMAGALAAVAAAASAQTRAGGTPETPTRSESRMRGDDFRRPADWRKGSELSSARLSGRDNEPLGDFEDLVVDPASGRVVYGVVRRGAADQSKFYAVPWSSVRGAGDARSPSYRLDMDAKRFEGAPHFTSDKWPTFSNRQ